MITPYVNLKHIIRGRIIASIASINDINACKVTHSIAIQFLLTFVIPADMHNP
jgi:hypothetical protein